VKSQSKPPLSPILNDPYTESEYHAPRPGEVSVAEVETAATATVLPAQGATMLDVAQLLSEFPDDFFSIQRQDMAPQPREDWWDEK
jgi:hypothetical protein